MSLRKLVEKILHKAASLKHAEVPCCEENIKELFFVESIAVSDQPNVVFVIPHQKDLGLWVFKVKSLLQGYFAEPPDVLSLPSISLYGTDRFLDHRLQRLQRLESLTALALGAKKKVIITTLSGLAQLSMTPSIFRRSLVKLKVGDELDLTHFEEKLKLMGYKPSDTVEAEGLYSLRGGILDVYSPGSPHPVRVEVFLESIRSMRFFDRIDQKSIEETSEVLVGPATEFFEVETDTKNIVQSLYDVMLDAKLPIHEVSRLIESYKKRQIESEIHFFLPQVIKSEATWSYLGTSLLVFPKGIDLAVAELRSFFGELKDLLIEDAQKQRTKVPIEKLFEVDDAKFNLFLSDSRKIEFDVVNGSKEKFLELDMTQWREISFLGENQEDPLESWLFRIEEILNDGAAIKVLAQSPERIDRIYYLLEARGILGVERSTRHLSEMLQDASLSPRVEIGIGFISSPLYLYSDKKALIPDYQLQGLSPKVRGNSRPLKRNVFQSFSDLVPSHLVVHHHHGVGRYQGLSRMSFGGIDSEFLIIEYAGHDRIYLPVDRLNMLSKYESFGDAERERSLDRLGGGFEVKKKKVKANAQEFAKYLLSEQAKRAASVGFEYGPASQEFQSFEADFPYEESDDQLSALEDIEGDFRSGKPMDRLICGDVGFGKTEVALRAAMRTVLEGYQVLVFVPTTLLCNQHFETFSRRMEKYAVRVEQINRFVAPSKSKKIISSLANGSVDILIGTHKLLGHDICPKKLGLLVIDEEQRFGVLHKEKIKSLRAQAHVLALSATPIPRTLHQAFVGLKEISLIATPPRQRLPIKTYIAPFDDEIIRQAVNNELRRGGQVFFVHNRVEEIDGFARRLSKIVPDARIAVAHGQMHEHRLEEIVGSFIEKRFDILVCTTIIEAGVDMPNVNTLIINKADNLGLSQLYQIRGRVGRSFVQAFAYLLFDPHREMTKEAKARLDTLASYKELGAGFHIAHRDLEIRGAGDLLGLQQSGHVHEVGLETYHQLLTEAIDELNGKSAQKQIDVELKIPINLIIPEYYIQSERGRLKIYKEVFSAVSEEVIDGIKKDMRDLYGDIPADVELLFRVAQLKLHLAKCSISALIFKDVGLELKFLEPTHELKQNILRLMDKYPKKYKALPRGGLFFSLEAPNPRDDPEKFLESVMIEINKLMYNTSVAH